MKRLAVTLAATYAANLVTQYTLLHHLAGRKAGIKLGAR